jgi:hypothetical protein
MILDALRAHLMDEEVCKEFCQAYTGRINGLRRDLDLRAARPYCAAILSAGAKARSISRRSFTAVSVSSIATSA